MATLKEWLRNKALSFLGLSQYEGTPGDDKLTFINDADSIVKMKVREYNIWYAGDGDELLNFYTRQNTIDYWYEPWYWRNKKSYFWAVGSTEEDIKRTHSGQPRNIVDTLVAVIGKPDVQAGSAEIGQNNEINSSVDKIITENKFWNLYNQKQMPLTLVEGWGCYKIDWDRQLSDTPIILYYKAEQVDFVIKSGKVIGVIFKDYYTDGKNKKYLITETRRIESHRNEEDKLTRSLYIEKEAFEVTGEDDYVKPVKIHDIPQFKDIEDKLVIEDFDKLFATPCIFYEDTNTDAYGRSIFTGKIDLFDDLDQCLSQAANAVRRSTPVEYIDANYLERDRKTGMPIQPKAFDRKFAMIAGAKGADGVATTGHAVEVTQPEIDFKQYSDQAIDILMQIVNGLMSPATLGIDISKRDNAEAQREKEKVTIFTRNMLVDAETNILKDLFSQALCAYELMNTGQITVKNYDMSINFSEFADDSFENKLTTLGDAYNKGVISTKMFLSKLYGHELSQSDYENEKDFLEKKQQEQAFNPFTDGVNNEENEQEPFN